MALTHVITLSLTDYAGKPGTVTVHCPATATVAQVQSLVNALCAELDPITGALITRAGVDLALTLPAGLKGAAIDNTDMNRGVNWRFSVADTQYSHTIRTPAAMDAIVAGENLTPTADTNDWITVILDGDAVTEPTNPTGADMLAALTQRVTFHK